MCTFRPFLTIFEKLLKKCPIFETRPSRCFFHLTKVFRDFSLIREKSPFKNTNFSPTYAEDLQSLNPLLTLSLNKKKPPRWRLYFIIFYSVRKLFLKNSLFSKNVPQINSNHSANKGQFQTGVLHYVCHNKVGL